MPSFKLWLWTLCALVMSTSALVARTGHQLVPRMPEHASKAAVKQTLDITWAVGNPNGNAREMIFVNGQFPSPNLFFDEDDDVEVRRRDVRMPRSQAMLMGGFRSRPKSSNPQPWHFISNNAKDINQMTKAAADPQLIMVSDWTNFTSDEYMQAQVNSELDIFCVDSILVNGKGSVFCPPHQQILDLVNPGLTQALLPGQMNDKGCLPFVTLDEDNYLPGRPDLIPPGLWEGCVATNGSMATIQVDPAAGWASLNIIMGSTLRIGVISVDNHEMYDYEIDGGYVQPVKCESVVLYPGQRHSVMIKLDQEPGNYTIRMADDGAAQVMSSYAVLEYKGGKPLNTTIGYVEPANQTEGFINYGGARMSGSSVRYDDVFNGSTPYPATPPKAPAHGDPMHVVSMGRLNEAWQWTLSGTELYPQDANAYAPLLYDPSYKFAKDPGLVIRTHNDTWVDIILQVSALPGTVQEIGHAIHKHSSKFWVTGRGVGIWNYTSVAVAQKAEPASFNFVNPPYRDTATTLFGTATWVALRYHSNNPGPWLLHCHVETHLAGGMAMAILDGVDAWPTVPPAYGINAHGYPSR
ncbi:MAG: hypothetical protein M1818_001646 [Claussenomyces sp. TS43310]|nr:MAG: hypothetical protein M1818_001646 [Claussenomyces sp. TS43310]